MKPEGSRAPGVVARGITKRLGGVHAVRGVDLTLPAFGVCGLLGPNGAGKTTTIRMIAGVLLPDAGQLQVRGLDALREGAALRHLIGYLPESAPLYPELTVREHLRFRADIVGIPGRAAVSAIERAARLCDVASFADRCCGTLSKGMQQRVGLAAALLGDPAVVILDEPSVGLDPAQSLAFRALIRELGQTSLVILSSHLLSEVECVCSELAVIAAGRVVVQESVERFRRRATETAGARAEVDRSVEGDADIRSICGRVVEQALADGWYRIEFPDGSTEVRSRFAEALLRQGIRLRSLGIGSGTLEEVFVDLVRSAAAADAARDELCQNPRHAGGRR